MTYQAVFKRYELKYLLSFQQKQKVLRKMEPYMQPDRYGHTVIRNIYFDTDSYRLIRKSLEKPVYKEKLRLRSYSRAEPNSEVFVELKKKFDSVVYKRRLSMSEKEAMDWVCGPGPCKYDTQISKEIDYFLQYYTPLRPTVFLSYERDAFYCRQDSDFRVTFDEAVLCREEDICLESEIYGTPLLDDGMTLMEIKCSGGIPLWMTEVLTRECIYKTSFSKYGTAYQKMIYPKLREEAMHA